MLPRPLCVIVGVVVLAVGLFLLCTWVQDVSLFLRGFIPLALTIGGVSIVCWASRFRWREAVNRVIFVMTGLGSPRRGREVMKLSDAHPASYSCPHCGFSFPKDTKFCANCGREVELPESRADGQV